jgi:hypothetical protein
MYEQIVTGYQARLTQIVERWDPEHHEEVRAMLNGLSRELVAELPAESSSLSQLESDRGP